MSIGCPPFSLGSGASPLASVDHTGISLFATHALWTEWRNPLPGSASAARDHRQSPWGGGWTAGTGRWQAGFQKESFARTRDAPAIHLLLPAVDNYRCPKRPTLTTIQRERTHPRMFHSVSCTHNHWCPSKYPAGRNEKPVDGQREMLALSSPDPLSEAQCQVG